MLFLLVSVLFASALAQSSFRLPPEVQWEDITYAGFVIILNDKTDTEVFAISGAYQYLSDGGAAFRSHMTMTLAFDGQESSEELFAVLPAEGNSYEYVIDDEDCTLVPNAVAILCEDWTTVHGAHKQTCKQELDKGVFVSIAEVVVLDSQNHLVSLKYNMTNAQGKTVVALSIDRKSGDDGKRPSDDVMKVPTACPPHA